MVSKSRRDLLRQLALRWPDPCYVVVTGQGRHALVVVSRLHSGALQRMPRSLTRATTIGARDAGLITMTWVAVIPRYGRRNAEGGSPGWLVAITPAGREALGGLAWHRVSRDAR